MKNVIMNYMIIWCFVFLGCATDYEKGVKAYQKEDWDEALNFLLKARQEMATEDSAYFDTIFKIGSLYHKLQKWETSIEYLQGVSENDRRYKEAQKILLDSKYQLGMNAYNQKYFATAVYYMKEIYIKNSNYENIISILMNSYYELGLKEYNRGNQESAIINFEQIKPQMEYYDLAKNYIDSSLFKMGKKHYINNNWKDALQSFKKIENPSLLKDVEAMMSHAKNKIENPSLIIIHNTNSFSVLMGKTGVQQGVMEDIWDLLNTKRKDLEFAKQVSFDIHIHYDSQKHHLGVLNLSKGDIDKIWREYPTAFSYARKAWDVYSDAPGKIKLQSLFFYF